MIESNPGINIKELILREPSKSSGKDLVFNPERDITDKNW
jgi:hypothetical protein